MILKNKKLNREIEIDFSFFREEYADVIKEAFDKYREEKLTLYPENFKDDYSMKFNFFWIWVFIQPIFIWLWGDVLLRLYTNFRFIIPSSAVVEAGVDLHKFWITKPYTACDS